MNDSNHLISEIENMKFGHETQGDRRGSVFDALLYCPLPHLKLTPGFQDATDATNDGFIIPSAGGVVAVYLMP